MTLIRRSVSIATLLFLSATAFGQVYKKELETYDLPGLQKKLELIDATLQTEPVVAAFLSSFPRFQDHSVTKALAFLDALKAAKANLNLPVKGDPSATPLVTAVRSRVEYPIVEWLITNGARYGANKARPDSLIDATLLQGDYPTAKLLVGLNGTLPVKERLPISDTFASEVAVLKDDVATVKKIVAASGSSINDRIWAAAIAGRSQKVCDFLMAVSDNHPSFITNDGNLEFGMRSVVLGNPTFLTQLLAGGYQPGRDLGQLMESARHEEQFDSLSVLVSSDKAEAWNQGRGLWTSLVQTQFDLFQSLTKNGTEIVVPNDEDVAKGKNLSYYLQFYYSNPQSSNEPGMMDFILQQGGQDTAKNILQRIPPAKWQLEGIKQRFPDLFTTLMSLDDAGKLQVILDTPDRPNRSRED